MCESSSGFIGNQSFFLLIFCFSFATPSPTHCHSFLLFSRISLTFHFSPISWLRLHAPHLLFSETPQGLPLTTGVEKRQWRWGRVLIIRQIQNQFFTPKIDLKASNQPSQSKEAAARHHGQFTTDLLYFQSDADRISCCLWRSEQLNV